MLKSMYDLLLNVLLCCSVNDVKHKNNLNLIIKFILNIQPYQKLLIDFFFLLVLNILIQPSEYYLIFLNTMLLVFLNLLNYKTSNNCKIFHYHFDDFFLLFHYAEAYEDVFYDVLSLIPLKYF